MNMQKVFASMSIVWGSFSVMAGIAQLMTNSFPPGSAWRTRAFYATLKYFFDSYAVDINAWIWITFGALFIYLGAKEWLSKSTDPNLNLSAQQKPHLLGRLRHRTSRKKSKEGAS